MSTGTRIIAKQPPDDGREWEPQCARCGSSVSYTRCDACEDGYSHHDCGEDTCCCLDPEPNVRCDQCGGQGGWYQCLSHHAHCETSPLVGRERIERGEIEWYTLDGAPL